MKKRNILLFALIPSLTSCIYGRGYSTNVVDASKIGAEALFEENVFSDSHNHIFSYYLVYSDKDDNFVFSGYGYIKSNNGVPDAMLKIDVIDGFEVYGIAGEDTRALLEATEDKDGQYQFSLIGYSNFLITNTQVADNFLGKLTFWS